MKAYDTNVLARFFVDDPDDPRAVKQRPAAIAALSERGFVSVTVLLEFEWVMRGHYGLHKTTIADVLLALVSIEHVSIEDRSMVLDAIEAFRQGFDFADALHLTRASRASAFITFDRGLAKRAAKFDGMPPVELAQ
jgi:predicted nucleic-acid-binding protein